MLTPEQIKFFHDNGYLIVRGLLPRRDIEAMQRAADELQEAAVSRLSQPGYFDTAKHLNKDWIERDDDHFVYRQKPDGAYAFHRVERMYTRQPIFRQIAMSSRLLMPAWQLLQRPFWPRGGAMVWKMPHEGAEVRWHQDIPYLYWSSGGHPSKGRPATHPIPNFNTDIYLDSSNRENGGLYVLPGTHRNGTVDVDKLVEKHGFDLPGAVVLDAEPGDVAFHHVAVVHGSPENHSPARRRTFYVHYLCDETVNDAYADWPNLLSAEENTRQWSEAMKQRKELADEGDADGSFEITPEGLAPRERKASVA